MTNQIDHIVEHLFHKKRLEEVSVTELESFIATHPYFAAGHFLLAKKTQSDNPGQSNQHIAKTTLYYNNPLWLQWLLDHDLNYYEQKHVEQYSPPSTDISEYHTEGNGQEPEENIGQKSTFITDSVSVVSEVVDVFPEGHSSMEEKVSDTIPVEIHQETGDEFLHDRSEQTESEFQTIEDPQQKSTDDYSMAENRSSEEDVQPELEQDQLTEEESRASAASIEKTLTSAALIPTKAEIEKHELSFEPYHTIDYFASQGIKLQQSDLSKDKFGKQLKSFTEWLRSMKRLPQASVEANMDEATQQSIQRIAEHSFEEKEIVTETMADVWIKQGNKEKAIDTLYKLSLLNPSKSHYFAAKIEQLKVS